MGELGQLFEKTFGHKAAVSVSAPGSVNLLGDHTDYNEGFVLPMALPMKTTIIGRRTANRLCRVLTTAQVSEGRGPVTFHLPTAEAPLTPGRPQWANYVKGVVAHFRPPPDNGFDAVISTTVPLGGGLSSSASLGVAVHTFLEALTGTKGESELSKALLCQNAEHEFPGMPCGLIDHFVSAMNKPCRALLIDCRTMQARSIPFKDLGVTILITNSNVEHEVRREQKKRTGKLRGEECQLAAAELGVEKLRDASIDEVENHAFSEELLRKRARHVISEIRRTREAAIALERGDHVQFGQLMLRSHESLRDDYEVSCAELNELVDLASSVEGVYGSRMTGGGLGGCTVTLCREDAVHELKARILEGYSGKPSFYICQPRPFASTDFIDRKNVYYNQNVRR